MFFIPFHTQMRRARLKRGLTQKQSASLCGMTRARWTQLEIDMRSPSPKELREIVNFLELQYVPTTPSSTRRRLINNGRRLSAKPKPFFPSGDRPNHVRYFTAVRRFPQRVKELTNRLRAREDFQDCAYLCHKLASGSYAEAIFVLRVLSSEALPCLLAPSTLGRPPRPIIDPLTRELVGHRPFPCLATKEAIYFFQVSFLTTHSLTVDVLRWRGEWAVLEIDGEGHNGEKDDSRSEALGLPIIRYNPRDVLYGPVV